MCIDCCLDVYQNLEQSVPIFDTFSSVVPALFEHKILGKPQSAALFVHSMISVYNFFCFINWKYILKSLCFMAY